jgi:hypothetical protein
MHHIDILQQVFSSDAALADDDRISPTRRSLLVASLLAALPLALSEKPVLAGSINPTETQVTLPAAIKWSGWINGFPPHSGEMALRRLGQARALSRSDEVVPWLYECSAQLRDRSPLARPLRHVVGQQRRRLRSGSHGSGPRGRIRQAGRADSAL